MSEFYFTTSRAHPRDHDLIDTKFHHLAEAAKANIANAKQDTKMAEGFCTHISPLECLVLQFSAPL